MQTLKQFRATDNFPNTPAPIQVLVYFAHHVQMYVVDIQHKNKLGQWYEDHDPFRSVELSECLAYYEELKQSSDYTDLVELL